MNSDNIDKATVVWRMWNNGIAQAAAIKMFNGTDDKLHEVWEKTIELIMEYAFESQDDYNEWKQSDPTEKYKLFEGGLLGYEAFISYAESGMDMLKTILSDEHPNDKENARNIISRSLSRAANREVKTELNLAPGTELMSSEMIAKLGITKEKLIESLDMDPQVKSVDCVNGEFIVDAIFGEIRFHLVFGDESRGGHS
jgi:hypothetical protein